MPANMVDSITVTRKGASVPKAKGLSSRGKITSVGETYDGKCCTVTIAHGPKRKPKKGEIAFSDYPATTTVSVSKAHAKMFTVGQKVRLVIVPDDGDGDDY